MMAFDQDPASFGGGAWAAVRRRLGTPTTWTSGVFASIAVLAVLPVIVFAIVTVRLSSDAIRGQVDDQIEASALASANVVEQHFGRLADVVEGTSEREGVRAAVESRAPLAMRTALESMIENRSDIQLAFLVDASGTLIDGLPVSPEVIGRNFDFRDWYQGVSSTQQTYVSEAFETAAVGTPLIYVVVTPVYSPTDPEVVLGYMGVGQTLESLQVFVDDFAASQGVSLTITDQAGTIVSAPGEAPTEIISLEEQAGFTADAIEPGSVSETTWSGRRHLSATAPARSFGWNVTADVPADEALAAAGRIRTTVIVVAVMLSTMVLVAVAAMARLLRRRHEAVERQAHSEAFLKTIIDNIPSIVIVKNAETLRIERINRVGQEALGSAIGELLGKNWEDALPPDEAKERMDEEREILASGEIRDVDVIDLDTPQGVRQFRSRRIPIAPQHNVPGFLLTIYDDISENLAALAALEAAKSEAERANAAKSDFLSRMSHELRTPLNAVIGFGQLLEMDHPTEQQASSIDQILRGGRHLLGLINEILDLARIETGRLSMSLEPLRIEGVVEEALDLVRPLAAENGIDLPGHLVPDDWPYWVFADQQRVKQVLINLLGNAIKYNRTNGRVTISCAVNGDRLRINVTDTGSGISQDQLATMFEPFERLGAETSAVEGTGLGLSLSKRLVEAMGGAMGVDTEVGAGSTFWIEIDIAPEPQVVGVQSHARPVQLHRTEDDALILYVEDNDSNILLVEQLVDQRADLSLMTAKSGETGAALAARHRPDLILLDLNLPGVSGHSVLRNLRSRPETMHIPVIILSADATPTQIDRLLTDGADHYLTKPVDVEQLMSTIDAEIATASAVG